MATEMALVRNEWSHAARLGLIVLLGFVLAFMPQLIRTFNCSASLQSGEVLPKNDRSNSKVLHQEIQIDFDECVGAPLPLLDKIDISAALRRGHCKLLFIRSDCSDCLECLRDFSEQARRQAKPQSVMFACVDLSNGFVSSELGQAVRFGKVLSNEDLLFPTLVIFDLDNGIVKSIDRRCSTPGSVVQHSEARSDLNEDSRLIEFAPANGILVSPRTTTIRLLENKNPSVILSQLRSDVHKVIDRYRELCARTDEPCWVRMHSLLLFGEQAWVARESHSGLDRLFDSILQAGTSANQSFFRRADLVLARRLDDFRGEYHRDQFLSYLSLAGVSQFAELSVEGQNKTVSEIVRSSQLESRTIGDVSCTLCAYAYYLPPEAQWKNKFGEPMNFRRLIEYVLDTPSDFCFGHHRRIALARILCTPDFRSNKSIAALLPRIENELTVSIEQLRRTQIPNGSLGFIGPPLHDLQANADLSTIDYAEIVNNGHSLDWICMISSAKQLKERWLLALVCKIADDLDCHLGPTHNQYAPIDVRNAANRSLFGAASHGISSLSRWINTQNEFVISTAQ